MNISNIKMLISGRKTYIVAILAIVGSILGWSEGLTSDEKTIELIVTAILFSTIRHGITQSTNQTVETVKNLPAVIAESSSSANITPNHSSPSSVTNLTDNIKITYK